MGSFSSSVPSCHPSQGQAMVAPDTWSSWKSKVFLFCDYSNVNVGFHKDRQTGKVLWGQDVLAAAGSWGWSLETGLGRFRVGWSQRPGFLLEGEVCGYLQAPEQCGFPLSAVGLCRVLVIRLSPIPCIMSY